MTDISVRPIGVMRGLPGTMQGPTVSVDGNVVTFNGTTGATVKDSGIVISSLVTILALTNALTLKANLDSAALTGNPTAPTPSPGDIDTSISTTAFVASAISSAILARIPTASIVLNVPSQYATIDLALAAANALVVLSGIAVTINVAAGSISRSTTLTLNAAYGDQLSIVGAATSTLAFTAIASVTGSTGAWAVVLPMASTTGINVGDIVGVESTATGTNHQVHRGTWKVTAVTPNTSITVTNTARNVTPPTGTTGNVRVYPTQIKFTGVSGIIGSASLLSNLALQGDGTASTAGAWATPIGTRFGKLQLSRVAVNGFGIEGFRANYGGIIYATNCFSSNNGNNGYMARDGGVMYLDGCNGSGNGFAAPAGGGNGFLSENNSAMFCLNPAAHGNVGDGMFARTSASILVDTTGPAFCVGNVNGLRASFSGFLQSIGGIIQASAGNGLLAEKQGHILATTAGITTSTLCGMAATDMGLIDATGSTITTTSSFGVSSQTRAHILCGGSALSGIGGATAFRADDFSWITMTGSTGTVTSSPAVNTVANNNAYIKS